MGPKILQEEFDWRYYLYILGLLTFLFGDIHIANYFLSDAAL